MAVRHEARRGALTLAPSGQVGVPPGGPAALNPEHLSRLLELARALSLACEHEDLARIAVERALIIAGAFATQIAVRRAGGGLEVVARAGGRAPAAPPSLAARAQEHDVLRSGAPVWLGTPAEVPGRYALDALAGEVEGAARAFLPLVADDEVHGVLTLVFDAARAFDEPTRLFLGEVAAACGSALARGSLFSRERARADAAERSCAAGELRQRLCEREVDHRTRLYERERFARARAEAETVIAVHAADDLEHAQRLAAELQLAHCERDVHGALAQHGLDGFGAAALALTRHVGGGVLETTTLAGPPQLFDPGADVAGAEATPAAEVLAHAAPLWLDPAELARRFAATATTLRAHGAGSWLGVPVMRDGAAAAVLSVMFGRARAFTEGDRSRLTLLASECASRLSRCAVPEEAAARADPPRAEGAARPRAAFVVRYEEIGRDGPVERTLGVFSSEATARAAVGRLDVDRSPVMAASITSWKLDALAPGARTELDLVAGAPAAAPGLQPSLPDETRPAHDLSVPGGRPLCGADANTDPPPRPARGVTCPACARLVEDAERRDTHAKRLRSDESEE